MNAREDRIERSDALNRWVLPIMLLLTARGAGAGMESHNASDYAIQVWQVEQGLPDNTVTAIQQTPDGYLWFGTFNGLVRFDGVRFEVFDTRTPGLESEAIISLGVDRAGGPWVSAESGRLAHYAEGRFTAFHGQDGWPMQSCKSRGIRGSSSGTVYFWTGQEEVLRFDGRRFERILMEGSSARLGRPAADGGGDTVWVVRNHVLYCVRDNRWIEFRSEAGARVADVGAVAPGRVGGMWLVCAGRLLRVDDTRGIVETVTLPPLKSALGWLMEDSGGRLWAGTWGDGLLQLERDG
jgi:ligand-binding sensor domain-containing protein